METHKHAVDARKSTDPKFMHWKSRFKLAAAVFEEGNASEARTLIYKTLMEAEGLADRDFAVPASQIAMAIVCMEEGNLKESKEYFDKGLNSLRLLGDDAGRELYAAALRFKAMWHDQNQDLTSAETCLRESVDILKNQAGASAVQLACSLNDLSFVLIRSEQLEEASELIRASMGILANTVGVEDASYDWAKMLYQVCLTRNDEALFIETFELSATELQYKRGGKHPNLVRALNAYAAALKKRGMTEQLEEAKEKFVALYKS